MAYFLLQNVYDKIEEEFIKGNIEKETFLRLCEIMESKRILFTVELN
jgi:hypothetical protein